MNVAFLFPGQGSQVPGMLHALPDHPTISRTLDEVSETLNQNVLQLDSSEALRSAVSVQLALLAPGVAVARTTRRPRSIRFYPPTVGPIAFIVGELAGPVLDLAARRVLFS